MLFSPSLFHWAPRVLARLVRLSHHLQPHSAWYLITCYSYYVKMASDCLSETFDTGFAQIARWHSLFPRTMVLPLPPKTGNKNGLLLPNSTTDQELLHIRNSLPESVVVRRVEERLSALGNCIACNDHVALVHSDLDRETEDIVADTLGVEVFRQVCLPLRA